MKYLAMARVTVAALLLIPMVASASVLSVDFTRITNNNAEDLSAQLGLDILDPTSAFSDYGLNLENDQVLFVFSNNVGTASNIAEIYIDNGPLSGLNTVTNSLGGGGFTEFTGGSVTPPDLPGGNDITPPFEADTILSADTVPGFPDKGINTNSDRLGITYTLDGGLAAIEAAFTATGDDLLRIGLHVRSIGTASGSDSYVNRPPSVPEPATLALLGIGLTGLGAMRRRKLWA